VIWVIRWQGALTHCVGCPRPSPNSRKVWQRALSLATDAAQATSAEAEGQLSRLKSQLELRQHTLSQREIELDELLRSRERPVKELEEHLRAAVSMLTKRDTTITSLESRLAAAQQETAGYRQRLAKVLQRAVTRQRRTETKSVAKPKKPVRTPKASPRHRPWACAHPLPTIRISRTNKPGRHRGTPRKAPLSTH
jgi:septal ring factor EnvC (AmiA/AmiB activator)